MTRCGVGAAAGLVMFVALAAVARWSVRHTRRRRRLAPPNAVLATGFLGSGGVERGRVPGTTHA